MTRTFIALEKNETVQRHLGEIISQVALLLPGVRWVNPAGIHITLAFLGELTEGELGGVNHAAQAAARHAAPFSYSFSSLGIFGSPRQPRVIWMGIEEPTGALQQLHRSLTDELAQRNFPVDRRPFSPHLTLARIKNPLSPDELQKLQRLLEDPQKELRSPAPQQVRHIDVMKSELSRSGAQYSILQSYELTGDNVSTREK